ncbi:MAG: hypothetical protein AAF585_23225 [Verrucomicrobiota bacterium]
MAIRDWGDDDTDQPDEPEKKSVGPGFWLGLILVGLFSPLIIQIPDQIREMREAKNRAMPSVCEARPYEIVDRSVVQQLPEAANGIEIEPENLKSAPDIARPADDWGLPVDFEKSEKKGGYDLAAFALVIPLGMDSVSPGKAAVEQLQFFNLSLDLLDAEQLETLGAAGDDLLFCKAHCWCPILRLMVQKSDSSPSEVGIMREQLFDQRTKMNVSGSVAPVVIRETQQLLIADLAIGIWHDTPIAGQLLFESGEPFQFEIEGLPTMPNSRDVEDLFDVKIPRVRIWFEESVAQDVAEPQLDLILAATQLRGARKAWPYRPANPHEGRAIDYYDTTPRELAKRLARDRSVIFDSEEMILLME